MKSPVHATPLPTTYGCAHAPVSGNDAIVITSAPLQILAPVSADIIERAMHTDLVADFIKAAERIHHTPAGPYRAVADAIEVALDEWAWDNRMPSADLSPEQRDRIAGELTARCWRACEEDQPALQFGEQYDLLCQANDQRRGMSV